MNTIKVVKELAPFVSVLSGSVIPAVPAGLPAVIRLLPVPSSRPILTPPYVVIPTIWGLVFIVVPATTVVTTPLPDLSFHIPVVRAVVPTVREPSPSISDASSQRVSGAPMDAGTPGFALGVKTLSTP